MGVTENPAAPGGVVEVANLTVWAADTTVTIDRSMGDPLLGPPPPVGPLRFDVDEAINRKIFLWYAWHAWHALHALHAAEVARRPWLSSGERRLRAGWACAGRAAICASCAWTRSSTAPTSP